jgi:uncharacterized metal-binding protein YceD (DUF177 family)
MPYDTQKSYTFATFFQHGKALGKFDTYHVTFKTMAPAEVCKYEYLLGNKFFMDIDGADVQKGKVRVSVNVERKASSFELKFHLEGVVYVPCDRCLDDMEQLIETKACLIVKLGREYAEESDEILVISEDEGALNLAWFLYEFVALAVPMKHVHPPGKCNKAMTSKLKKHATGRTDDENGHFGYMADDEPPGNDEPEIQATDPRWDALKDLM